MNRLFVLFSVLVVLIATICEIISIAATSFTYPIQLLFVCICVIYIIRHKKNDSIFLWGVSFFACLIISFLLNSEYGYIEIIKLICYFLIFYAGYCANFSKKYISFNLKRKTLVSYLYVIIFIPILLNFYQRIIGVPPVSIFVNSNNYVFYGFASSFLYYAITGNKKFSIILLLVYVLTGSTLGALLALILSLLIFLRKHLSIKHISLALFLAFLGVYAIIKIDLPIFLRIRDTINIAMGVFSEYSFKNIVEYDYVTAMSYGEDAANTSFLFRIKHWYNIYEIMLKSSLAEIFFGHGDFSLFKISDARLPAHNDYLMILFDFGLLAFILVLKYIITILKAFKNNFTFIFILCLFVYSITENLYTNFIACQIFYFLVGAYYAILTKKQPMNYNYENTTNK